MNADKNGNENKNYKAQREDANKSGFSIFPPRPSFSLFFAELESFLAAFICVYLRLHCL